MANEEPVKIIPVAVVPAKVIMTANQTTPEDNTVLETKAGKANVQIVVMSAWKQVAVRAVRTYLQSLGSLLAVVTTPVAAATIELITDYKVPAIQFYQLFLISASASVAPMVGSIIHNTTELLKQYDKTNPEMRA